MGLCVVVVWVGLSLTEFTVVGPFRNDEEATGWALHHVPFADDFELRPLAAPEVSAASPRARRRRG